MNNNITYEESIEELCLLKRYVDKYEEKCTLHFALVFVAHFFGKTCTEILIDMNDVYENL